MWVEVVVALVWGACVLGGRVLGGVHVFLNTTGKIELCSKVYST